MTINELGKKIKTLKGYPLRTDIAVTVINSEDSVSKVMIEIINGSTGGIEKLGERTK